MLKLEGQATITSVLLRKEHHGDDLVKAFSVKCEFENVDVDTVRAWFVGDFDHMFDKEQPRFNELKPFERVAPIENVKVQIGTVSFLEATINKIRLTPLPGRVADVSLNVSAAAARANANTLHGYLMETAKVRAEERQLDLATEPE